MKTKKGQIVAVHWRDISSYSNIRSHAFNDPEWIRQVTSDEKVATTYGEVVADTGTHIILATHHDRDKYSYTTDAMVIPYGVIIEVVVLIEAKRRVKRKSRGVGDGK